MRGLDVTGQRNGTLAASYHPSDVRFDTVYDLLGKQVEPCVFEPGPRLLDALFPEGGAEDVRVFNISDDHEGLGERFVGWSFRVSYTPVERCPFCGCRCSCDGA